MPANVDQMFSVREMPWHREGVVLDDYPQDFATARTLAGLDWDPIVQYPVIPHMDQAEYEKLTAMILMDAETSETEKVSAMWQLHQLDFTEDRHFRRIYRNDTGATLSYQADSYEVINNGDFGEILEAVLKVGGGNVKLETGGCLEGGKKVWMLALMDDPIEVPGDSSLTLPYLALTSRHDAAGSCALRSTTVRIVCANTFSAAEMEGERTGTVFSFVHRGNWRDRIEEATKAVQGVKAEIAEYREIANTYVERKVSTEQTDLFVAQFFPEPPAGVELTDRQRDSLDESRGLWRSIYNGPTVDGSGIAGTFWGWVQASGEYMDTQRKFATWESGLNKRLLNHEKSKARAVKVGEQVLVSA